MKRGHNKRGFTIVELLIVIVVIGILAAITIVAYIGAQQRARDAQRKSDLAQIEKSLLLWSTTTGKVFAEMNASGSGTGIGWFDVAYSSPVSTKQLLINSNLLAVGIQDPLNIRAAASSSFAYMIAECTPGDATRRVVLAQLEIPPTETLSQQLGTTCTASTFTDYSTNYRMNFGKLVKLQP